MNTTTTVDTYTCPLHPGRDHCPCIRSEVLTIDLAEPAAIGLWECTKGHRTVGPPTIRTAGGHSLICQPGCQIIRRLGVSVVPSRLNGGTPTP